METRDNIQVKIEKTHFEKWIFFFFKLAVF